MTATAEIAIGKWNLYNPGEVDKMRRTKKTPYDAKLNVLARKLEELDYKGTTSRVYLSKARDFLEYCGGKPEQAKQVDIESYLTKVLRKEQSRSVFLQTCTSIELLYDYVVKKKPYHYNFITNFQKDHPPKPEESRAKDAEQRANP